MYLLGKPRGGGAKQAPTCGAKKKKHTSDWGNQKQQQRWHQSPKQPKHTQTPNQQKKGWVWATKTHKKKKDPPKTNTEKKKPKRRPKKGRGFLRRNLRLLKFSILIKEEKWFRGGGERGGLQGGLGGGWLVDCPTWRGGGGSKYAAIFVKRFEGMLTVWIGPGGTRCDAGVREENHVQALQTWKNNFGRGERPGGILTHWPKGQGSLKSLCWMYFGG